MGTNHQISAVITNIRIQNLKIRHRREKKAIRWFINPLNIFIYLSIFLILNNFFPLIFQPQPSSIAEAMILDTEAAVMANFEFLAHTDIDMDEDENDGEEEMYDSNPDSKQNKVRLS